MASLFRDRLSSFEANELKHRSASRKRAVQLPLVRAETRDKRTSHLHPYDLITSKSTANFTIENRITPVGCPSPPECGVDRTRLEKQAGGGGARSTSLKLARFLHPDCNHQPRIYLVSAWLRSAQSIATASHGDGDDGEIEPRSSMGQWLMHASPFSSQMCIFRHKNAASPPPATPSRSEPSTQPDFSCIRVSGCYILGNNHSESSHIGRPGPQQPRKERRRVQQSEDKQLRN